MSNTQIVNRPAYTHTGAQIVDAVVNGKYTPVITITGGAIAFGLIGLLVDSIHKGVRFDCNIKNWLSLSFAPEPAVQLTYIGDGLRVSDNT